MIIVIIIAFLALAAAVSLFEGWLLWLVWNLVVEGMFDGPHLGYWVAVLLLLVFNVLFGGTRVNVKGRD